jgi:hypothetical protein
LQEALFRFFDEISGTQASLQTATSVAEALGQSNHPTSKLILRRLLKHPSKHIAEAAAHSLRSMGEQVTMPPRLGPVQFAIRVNGVPFAEKKVGWKGMGPSGSIQPRARGAIWPSTVIALSILPES